MNIFSFALAQLVYYQSNIWKNLTNGTKTHQTLKNIFARVFGNRTNVKIQ